MPWSWRPLAAVAAATASARRRRPHQEVARRIRRRHQGAADHPAGLQSASARARAPRRPTSWIPTAGRRRRRCSQHRSRRPWPPACSGNYTLGEKHAAGQCRRAERRSRRSAPNCSADQRAACRTPTAASPTSVLFGTATPDTGKPVNADAEVDDKPRRQDDRARPRKTAAAGLTGSRASPASAADCRARWRGALPLPRACCRAAPPRRARPATASSSSRCRTACRCW